MNINRAPISRILSTATKNETTFASPSSFGKEGVLASGAVSLASGRAITVFFEVPSYPLITNQIQIKLHESTTGECKGLHALPNVYLTDADSYMFIRGNSVIANSGTPATGCHVVYSAILDGVLPVSRAQNSSASWVQPGDSMILNAPTGYSSNQIAVATVEAQILTVRQRSNNTYMVDFTVGINPGLITSSKTGWAKNELMFYTGTAGAPTAVLGLASDQLNLDVAGASGGATLWKGTLRSTTNLSYPSANKAGVLPALNASEYLLASKSWLASSGLPAKNNTLDIYSDPDYNSGAMPFKCLSIVDNSDSTYYYNLEISIIPMY